MWPDHDIIRGNLYRGIFTIEAILQGGTDVVELSLATGPTRARGGDDQPMDVPRAFCGNLSCTIYCTDSAEGIQPYEECGTSRIGIGGGHHRIAILIGESENDTDVF